MIHNDSLKKRFYYPFASNLKKHCAVNASILHDCYDHTFHFYKCLVFTKYFMLMIKFERLKGIHTQCTMGSWIESWSRKRVSVEKLGKFK